MRKTPLAVFGFEDGRVPGTSNCGQPLEAGQCMKTYCPLDLPKGNAALLTP